MGQAQRESTVDEARALFLAGETASQEGRWADAVVAFERAYHFSGAPTALFNSSFAYRALGRYQTAHEGFTRLLTEHGDADPALLESARELDAQVVRRLATIILQNLPESTVAVQLNGANQEDEGERPWRFEVDPGEHRVSVEREGYETFEWREVLSDGQTRGVDVMFSAVASPPELPEPEEVEPSETVFESPWFWIVTGVVLVGAGVSVGVILATDGPAVENPGRQVDI